MQLSFVFGYNMINLKNACGESPFCTPGRRLRMDISYELFTYLLPFHEVELFYRAYFYAKKDPQLLAVFLENYKLERADREKRGMWLPEFHPPEPFELDEEKSLFETLGDDISINKHTRYSPAVRHRHTFLEMMYVMRGQCDNCFESGKVLLREGDICIISPGVWHTVGVFDDQTLLLNIMIRKSTFCETFLSLMKDDNVLTMHFIKMLYKHNAGNYILFHTEGDDRLHTVLDLLCMEGLQKRAYAGELTRQLLMSVFHYILRNHTEHIEISGETDAKIPVISQILRYIRIHYKNATLRSTAEAFHYTPQHLSGLIRKGCGNTFIGLLQKIRIEQACNLLVSTNYTAGDISRMVGYENAEHFHRKFKKYMGCTPNDYRRTGQPNGGLYETDRKRTD